VAFPSVQLFEFGDRYRGTYDSSIAEVRSFYASVSGYRDELLWAALWLHRATGREDYLRYAVDNNADGGWAITEFSWDVKYAGVQVLAAKVRSDPHARRSRSPLSPILNHTRSSSKDWNLSREKQVPSPPPCPSNRLFSWAPARF
jgi:hypothetical protein